MTAADHLTSFTAQAISVWIYTYTPPAKIFRLDAAAQA